MRDTVTPASSRLISSFRRLLVPPQLDAMNLEQAERWFIERTLGRYEGNVGRAAEQLGLSRSALYRRLQKPDPGE